MPGFLITRGLFTKLLLFGLLLFLAVAKVAAQTSAADSAKALILIIRQSQQDTNKISLQLKLAKYYLSKPGSYKQDLDSAYTFITQATELSQKLHENEWQCKAFKLAGEYYAETGNYTLCKEYFMRAITYYHQTGNSIKEADAWYSLGESFYSDVNNSLEMATISFYQHSRILYLQARQPIQAATALCEIADLRSSYKQYAMADKELQQALVEFKTCGYTKLQDLYQSLADVESYKGNYYRAMAYTLEAIKSMNASGDLTLAAQLYDYAGTDNEAVGNYNEALNWRRKAVAIDKNGPYRFIYETAIIKTLLTTGKIDEAGTALKNLSKIQSQRTLDDTLNQYWVTALYYEKINKPDVALKYYTKILYHVDRVIRRQEKVRIDYRFWSIVCDNHIAGIYIKTNRTSKARKHLDDIAVILQNAPTSIYPEYLIDYYDHLYKYDVATGNNLAAVKNLERHDKIKDSLFTVDKDNKISELNIQYQTAQSEQAIKDLHNQGVIQQARLEKANLQRNITIGGVLLLLILAGIAYKGYLNKQRSNLQLVAQQQRINTQNAALQHLLTEKEWLLKEVHHRVKNNLHTVICLLQAQARHLENDAREAIENSKHRIYAMSLIHQKLYQADDIKTIDMAVYIPELIQSLKDGFGLIRQIIFNLHIDPVELTISHAVPLGLIINETVTNSIKYAFPGKRQAEITISMVNTGDMVKLEMSDNGIGMPPIDPAVEPESMGLRLMKGLCEDIDARISFETDQGTKITIIFKPDALNDVDGFLESTDKRKNIYDNTSTYS